MSRYGINAAAVEGIFGFISRSKQAIHTCTKLAILEIGRRLVLYSAIGDMTHWQKPRKGYVPGQFVNNWTLGIDGVTASRLRRPDINASGSLASFTKQGRWPAYHDYFFVNNTPYAYRLEYEGHSWQVPPGGMVGRVRLEFSQVIQKVIEQYHAGVGDVTSKNQVSSAYGD